MSVEEARYKLLELIAQCDPNAPMPSEMLAWDQAESVGLEQGVMGEEGNIRESVSTPSASLKP